VQSFAQNGFIGYALVFTLSINTPGSYTFTATEIAAILDVTGPVTSRVFVVK
jgi:hypothetical protein